MAIESIKEIIGRAGLSLLAAATMACSAKPSEKPTPKPVAAVPIPTGYFGSFEDSQITITFPDESKPENGSQMIIVHPQVLIFNESFTRSILAGELKTQFRATRQSPLGRLNLQNAPQFGSVIFQFLVGKEGEARARDFIELDTNAWELRPSHMINIGWRKYCIQEFILDGQQFPYTPSQDCSSPNS